MPDASQAFRLCVRPGFVSFLVGGSVMIRLVFGLIMVFAGVGSIEMSEGFPASDAEDIDWLCLLAFGTVLIGWGVISLAEKDRLAKPL